jgi:PAS domain S-box-containing protein
MGRQVLDFSEANCKNCYKCVKTCKVKAIRVKNHQAKIERKLCIACGECFRVCSQNARKIHTDMDKVISYIKNGENVIASIAPAYRGYFKKSKNFIGLIKNMGINIIEETGIGAEYISNEYINYIKNSNKNIHLSSSCASINSLVEKHYPQYKDYLIPITTPLLLHGQIIKEKYKNAKVVFIGPCLSKKTEILSLGHESFVDAVLTFDELLEKYGDTNNYQKMKVDKRAGNVGRIYAKSGGIGQYLDLEGFIKIKVEGVANAIDFLNSIEKIKDKKIFVEINACKGGCLGGPGGEKCKTNYYERLFNIEQKDDYTFDLDGIYDTTRYFYNKKYEFQEVEEIEIQKILHSMEKYSKEDELNCGACGYNSCREKAIAVCNNMSTIDMCIPFMRNRAERISNEIFENSPNGIFIVDKNLLIKEVNPAAKEKFYLGDEVLDKSISNYIKDVDFENVLKEKKNIIKKKVCYNNYGIIALKNIIYLEDPKALLIIITNITNEEKQKEEIKIMKQNTLMVTQGVIEKQMRVAQEIASLLGETTAETKVALTKLKRVVEGELE